MLDVEVVNMTLPLDELEFTFDNKFDQSKFAIAHSADSPYVCVGDVNRQRSHFKRGGGVMCFSNTHVWLQFHQLVQKYSKCARDEL